MKVDFRKLLQHETTKRLLLEKELEACHSSIASLESSATQREASLLEDKSTAEHLQKTAQSAAKNVIRYGLRMKQLNAQLLASR